MNKPQQTQSRGPRAVVMTLTPTYTGDVCADYACSIAISSAHCMMRGIWLDPRFAPGFSLVEYARNYLVASFLRSKATHLFWIDADLWWQPDAIARLVQRDKDVICGVYPAKHPTAPFFPYTALGPPGPDGLQKAHRVPGGFMCVKRHVIETVAKTVPWHEIESVDEKLMAPRIFDLRLDGDKLVGEDFVAAERIIAAGFDIWVEPNIAFKHFGRRAWGANLAETLKTNGNQPNPSVSDPPQARSDRPASEPDGSAGSAGTGTLEQLPVGPAS